jgi:predicted PurR-regulated permease PerM
MKFKKLVFVISLFLIFNIIVQNCLASAISENKIIQINSENIVAELPRQDAEKIQKSLENILVEPPMQNIKDLHEISEKKIKNSKKLKKVVTACKMLGVWLSIQLATIVVQMGFLCAIVFLFLYACSILNPDFLQRLIHQNAPASQVPPTCHNATASPVSPTCHTCDEKCV